MKVKDLMSSNIVCAGEDTPVLLLAAHMRKNNIGSLPVCDSAGRLKGVVTDRDIVIRVLARFSADHHGDSRDQRISGVTAGDIMTKQPVTVSPDMNVHDAALLFSAHQIRRLPVTETSRLVGMLSLGDLAVKPVHIDEAGDALSAISLSGGLRAGN